MRGEADVRLCLAVEVQVHDPDITAVGRCSDYARPNQKVEPGRVGIIESDATELLADDVRVVVVEVDTCCQVVAATLQEDNAAACATDCVYGRLDLHIISRAVGNIA